MSEELKACPFCGYKAGVMAPRRSTMTQREGGYDRYQFGVECQANLDCAARVYGFPDQDTANKMWNRRKEVGSEHG